MALMPQNIPINFAMGIDTKSPRKQLQGKLISLQNASMQSPGQFLKRDGYAALPNGKFGSGNISFGYGLQSFQNELNELDGQNLYSYMPTQGNWLSKGAMTLMNLGVTSVVRNQFNQSGLDSAYNATSGKLWCYTWKDSGSGGVNYSIFDAQSNTALVSNAVLSATATKCKVLAIGSFFVFIYYDSGSTVLEFNAINVTSPNVLLGTTQISTDINRTYQAFDATYSAFNNSIYITWSKRVTNTTGIVALSSALTLGLPGQTSTNSGNPANVMSVVTDPSGNVWVSYNTAVISGPTSSNIECYALSASLLTQVLNPTNVATSQLAINITAYISGTAGTYKANIYWEETTLGTTDEFIRVGTITQSAVVTGPSVVIRGVGLASKVFLFTGSPTILIVYDGTNPASTGNAFVSIQPTYFLYNIATASIMAKLAPGNAGGFCTTGLLPEIISVVNNSYNIPYQIKDDLSSSSGGVFYNLGMQIATFTFATAAPSKQIFGNNSHFSGGQLWAYDGNSVVEQGFHLFPEDLSGVESFWLSGVPVGGLGPGASTASVIQFQYIAIYEWQDNQGQLHKSGTSVPLTITYPEPTAEIYNLPFSADITQGSNVLTSVSGNISGMIVGQVVIDETTAGNFPAGTYITSIGSGTITLSNVAANSNTTENFLTLDTMAVTVTIPTLRCTDKSGVTIVLYRTTANGSIFYRVSSLTSQLLNNPSADSVTFKDITPDVMIIGNEQLYTTGGEVDNLAPPAVSVITSFKNRMVYLSPENPYQWGYSKEVIPGSPVEFNYLEFVENVNQSVGALSAAHEMDDKLILFGSSGKKFYVAGDGPSAAGTNDDYTEATEIIGTTTCTNQSSIVKTPIGIFYQDPIKGIWLLDRSLQEQYIGAEVEMYNSSTITSAQLYPTQNKVMFTLSSGINLIYDYYVKQWEVDPFASNSAMDSTIYQNKLTYSQPNGIVLQQTPGQFTDNGSFIPMSLITNWFSFAGIEGFQRVLELQILGTWKSAHTLTINIYTDFSTTPVETITIPVLTRPPLYQYRIKPIGGKCEAMQIEIIESQTSSFGEGLAISNLAFRVGVKKGLNKLPAGESY